VTTPRGHGGPKVVLAAIGGALAFGIVYATFRTATSDPAGTLGTNLEPSALGERVLVIAPHPDDEIVNPAGLIAQARARGATVKVVLLTVGDGYRRAAARLTKGPVTSGTFLRLGELRVNESRAALGELGVPAEDRIYLAYSDGSLNGLWDLDWDPARPHLGANGKLAVPYPFAYRPGTVFCGANLADDLVAIIEQYRPTSIVYPDASDRHHDHWGAAAFCDYAMQRVSYSGLRLSYITHYGHYPYPWAYLPSAYLRPPSAVTDVGLRWHSLPLPREVEALKRRAVDQYRSQMRVADMRVYLLAFVRRNELFASYTPRPITRAPTDAVPALTSRAVRDAAVREPAAARPTHIIDRFGTIRDVHLVRGPSTVWMGIHTTDGTPDTVRYDFGLRLLGKDTRRIDVTVIGDRATPARMAEDSVLPERIRVVRSDETVWIGLDASVIDGYGSCLIGARTSFPRTTRRPCRSAWRPVILQQMP
jgi:N-acetyl-1-D-myo-inositol-2-amino-2-deoxy-alpha-D-glucopyranoside deacetylase